jgi:hypothetical protein
MDVQVRGQLMEEHSWDDLCEDLHDLADDMENYSYWRYNRKKIIERLRELAGPDTRLKEK